MTIRRVAIIHPWLPQYRLGLFELLTKRLGQSGIELDIFVGSPERAWSLRGDQIDSRLGIKLDTKEYSVLGRTLLKKDISKIDFNKYDLVIVEQAIRNLETYSLVKAKVPLAYWGHGRTYTQSNIWLLEKLKIKLTRRGIWFFSYTEGGRDHLVSKGIDPKRVTVLNNTFDSEQLKFDLAQIDPNSVAQFRREQGLTPDKTALYLGALDPSKRLDLLIQSCELVFTKDPSFRLLIVGSGPEKARLAKILESKPWATLFDAQFGEQKALLLRTADVLCIPGRVGLIAIDSFTASVPIVTTPDPFHPPEFEYLQSGFNSLVSEDISIESYSKSIVEAMDLRVKEKLKKGCVASSSLYSLENMVNQFAKGIRAACQVDPEVHL